MSQQDNIAALETFGKAVSTGDFSLFKDVVAPNSVDHDPAPGQGPGPEGFVTFFSKMRTAFPDMQASVEHMVADDDNVSMAYTLSGTHQGEFMGAAPTGRPFKIRGMQISRFENGMMVERWGSSDELGLMQQLGIAPKAG